MQKYSSKKLEMLALKWVVTEKIHTCRTVTMYPSEQTSSGRRGWVVTENRCLIVSPVSSGSGVWLSSSGVSSARPL